MLSETMLWKIFRRGIPHRKLMKMCFSRSFQRAPKSFSKRCFFVSILGLRGNPNKELIFSGVKQNTEKRDGHIFAYFVALPRRRKPCKNWYGKQKVRE